MFSNLRTIMFETQTKENDIFTIKLRNYLAGDRVKINKPTCEYLNVLEYSIYQRILDHTLLCVQAIDSTTNEAREVVLDVQDICLIIKKV